MLSFVKNIMLALALALLTCGLTSQSAQASDDTLVFAAASLQQSLDAVANAWTLSGHPPVRLSYAASSTIARQIEQGAPADIFISANQAWMDYLSQKNLIDNGSRRDLLGNRLVLIAPKSSAVSVVIESGFDIKAALKGGRLAMADTASVPAGQYGVEALKVLKVWEFAETAVVQGGNVRDALAFVARGEATLGIVYATDARIEPRVSIVGEFPANTHPAIIYPAALTARPHDGNAEAFFSFLHSRQAGEIFESYGFSLPEK